METMCLRTLWFQVEPQAARRAARLVLISAMLLGKKKIVSATSSVVLIRIPVRAYSLEGSHMKQHKRRDPDSIQSTQNKDT